MIGDVITPTKVIYDYDGPAIFVATVGLSDFLFYKAAEDNSVDLFIASETNDFIINAMLAGQLSVLGALREGKTYLFRFANGLQIADVQKVDFSHINNKLLPKDQPQYIPISPTPWTIWRRRRRFSQYDLKGSGCQKDPSLFLGLRHL